MFYIDNDLFKAMLIDRFMSKVVKENCWTWVGTIMKHGRQSPYGMISIKRKMYLAHRVSYFLFNNINPKQNKVLHRCDNPRCVNPDHLFLGTQKDNVRDMMQKGRAIKSKGESHYKSILTREIVDKIRKDKIDGLTYSQLMVKYNLKSKGHLGKILSFKVWR